MLMFAVFPFCLKKKKILLNKLASFFHSLPKQMHDLARSRSLQEEAVGLMLLLSAVAPKIQKDVKGSLHSSCYEGAISENVSIKHSKC